MQILDNLSFYDMFLIIFHGDRLMQYRKETNAFYDKVSRLNWCLAGLLVLGHGTIGLIYAFF